MYLFTSTGVNRAVRYIFILFSLLLATKKNIYIKIVFGKAAGTTVGFYRAGSSGAPLCPWTVFSVVCGRVVFVSRYFFTRSDFPPRIFPKRSSVRFYCFFFFHTVRLLRARSAMS